GRGHHRLQPFLLRLPDAATRRGPGLVQTRLRHRQRKGNEKNGTGGPGFANVVGGNPGRILNSKLQHPTSRETPSIKLREYMTSKPATAQNSEQLVKAPANLSWLGGLARPAG